MPLSVKKFLNMRPQFPFRFSADISIDNFHWDDILNISVKSVKVNLGESDTTKGAVYYGNGYFTIPVFNPAERTLEMSFTETDNMDILKTFDAIQEEQFNRTPIELFIRVTEYDEKMTNELSKILYTCILKEYSEPAFNRTGGVNIATIDAAFIIKDMKALTLNSDYEEDEIIKTNDDSEIVIENGVSIYSEGMASPLKSTIDVLNDEGPDDPPKKEHTVLDDVSEESRAWGAQQKEVLDERQTRNDIAEQEARHAEEEQKRAEMEQAVNETYNFNVDAPYAPAEPPPAKPKPEISVPAEPEQGQKEAEKQQEAKEEKKKEAKKPVSGEIVEGVDVDRLKKILGKAEGSTNFVYSNIIKDKESRFNTEQLAKIKNGERIKGKNGTEYWWDADKQSIVHYDIATVGKGLTFKNALANEDVTLTDEKGNKVTKKGKEWDKIFEAAGRDKLPNGKGKNMGGTNTTTKWNIAQDHAEDLFNESLASYIKDAKKQAIKTGLNWNDLSQEEKLVLVDSDYNGGAGKAKTAAEAMKFSGKIDNYDSALTFAENTTNTEDTLRRLDLVYGTEYQKQFKKKKKKT